MEQQQYLPLAPSLALALAAVEVAVVAEVGHTRKLAQFVAFHRANPRIYDLVERFALQAAGRRRTQYGISMVWERIRWELYVETDSGDEFKLNNNHRALYARLFMAHHPEYGDLFEVRRLHAEGFPED